MKGAITLESVSSDSIEDKGTGRVGMKCKECRKVNTYSLTYLLTHYQCIKLSINSLREKKKKKEKKKPNGNGRKRGLLHELVSRGAKIYIAYTNRNHFLTSITTSDPRIAQPCNSSVSSILCYTRYTVYALCVTRR